MYATRFSRAIVVLAGSLLGCIGEAEPVPNSGPPIVEWTSSVPYDGPLEGHGLFVQQRDDGAYVYVMGGGAISSDGVTAFNSRLSAARVLVDSGTLGAWEHAPLPFGLGFLFGDEVSFEVGDRTHLGFLGGVVINDSQQSMNRQLAALEIAANGAGSGLTTLEPVYRSYSARLDVGVVRPTTTTFTNDSGTQTYLIGGRQANPPAPVATVLAYDGAHQWRPQADLPMPREGHGLLRPDSTSGFYIIGGVNGITEAEDGFATDIIRPVFSGSDIAGWEVVGVSPSLTDFAAFIHREFVFLLGGRTPAGISRQILRAEILADGLIGPFESIGELPAALLSPSVVRIDNHICLCGAVTDGQSESRLGQCLVGAVD